MKNIIHFVSLFVVLMLIISCGGSGGGDQTPPGATNPVTGEASSVGYTSATLNGSFDNLSGYLTTVWYEYGTTAS